jgi:WD40 repeat protein
MRLPAVVLLVGLASAAQAEEKAGVDLVGDPLPSGARLRLGSVRLRHGGVVRAVAFSQDGRFVASAGDDRLVSIWEEKTGREIVRCEGHTGAIRALALTADGRTVVSGSDDGTVRVWDISRPGEGVQTQRIDLEGEIETMAVERNVLAAGTSHGVIALWDLARRERLHELRQEGGIFVLALAPAANTLATSGDPRGLRVWDVRSGKILRSFGDDVFCSAAFSPDGAFLATGDFDNRVTLWDAHRGEAVRAWEAHDRVKARLRNGVFGVAFTGDGKQLASAGADGTLRLWQTTDGKQVLRLIGHTGHARAVAFRSDGKRIVSGGADGTVRIWDVGSEKELFPAAAPLGPILSMSPAPDGTAVATIHPPNRLAGWDATTGRQRRLFARQPESAAAVAWSPDGKTLAIATPQGNLDLWEPATGKNRSSRRDVPRPMELLVWSSNSRLLASWGSERDIDVWDGAKGGLEQHITPGSAVQSALRFAADGALLAAGARNGSFSLWDPWSGAAKLPHAAPQTAPILAVGMPARGQSLVTCSTDGVVTLWERATLTARRRIEGRPRASAAALSRDCRLAALGTSSGGIEVFRLADGRSLGKFSGHRGPVHALAFTDRSRLLFSGGADGTVLVWDTRDLLEEAPAVTAPADLDRVWRQLGDDDTVAAGRAIDILLAAPDRATPLIRERLRPVPKERIARLIAELDDDRFSVREKASQQISLIGRVAIPTLEKALDGKISPELQRRIAVLLEKLDSEEEKARAVPVQALRALEVLEVIDSKESRELLETLARNSDNEGLARAAREIIERLAGTRRQP